MTQASDLLALLTSTELERDLPPPGSQLLRSFPLEGLWLPSFAESDRGLTGLDATGKPGATSVVMDGVWADMLRRPLGSGIGDVPLAARLGCKSESWGCWRELLRRLESRFSLCSFPCLVASSLPLRASVRATGSCFIKVARFVSGDGGIGAIIWGFPEPDSESSPISSSGKLIIVEFGWRPSPVGGGVCADRASTGTLLPKLSLDRAAVGDS